MKVKLEKKSYFSNKTLNVVCPSFELALMTPLWFVTMFLLSSFNNSVIVSSSLECLIALSNKISINSFILFSFKNIFMLSFIL